MIQYLDWNSGIGECFDGIFSHTQGLSHYIINGPVKSFWFSKAMKRYFLHFVGYFNQIIYIVNKEKFMQ